MVIGNNNLGYVTNGIIYVEDFGNLKEYSSYMLPNNIVIGSYEYNLFKDYRKYSGYSYEMYYLDNNSNIHQMTYNVQEGNGLTIDENGLMSINIDDYTIQNSKNGLVVNTDHLNTAYSYYQSGLIKGDNKLYRNFLSEYKDSGFVETRDGIVSLNHGFVHDLLEIKDIEKNIDIEINNINIMLENIFKSKKYVIGDLLYYDFDSKQLVDTDNINTIPYMICVISSDTTDDKLPRFIRLEDKNYHYPISAFSEEQNGIHGLNSYTYVPVFEVPLSQIKPNSNIVYGSYGFIAIDRYDWLENFVNPFNYEEHYYCNSNPIYTEWYLDASYISYNNPQYTDWTIFAGGFYTFNLSDEIKSNVTKFEDLTDYICVKYNNLIKHYKVDFKYDKKNNKYVSSSDVIPISGTNGKYVLSEKSIALNINWTNILKNPYVNTGTDEDPNYVLNSNFVPYREEYNYSNGNISKKYIDPQNLSDDILYDNSKNSASYYDWEWKQDIKYYCQYSSKNIKIDDVEYFETINNTPPSSELVKHKVIYNGESFYRWGNRSQNNYNYSVSEETDYEITTLTGSVIVNSKEYKNPQPTKPAQYCDLYIITFNGDEYYRWVDITPDTNNINTDSGNFHNNNNKDNTYLYIKTDPRTGNKTGFYFSYFDGTNYYYTDDNTNELIRIDTDDSITWPEKSEYIIDDDNNEYGYYTDNSSDDLENTPSRSLRKVVEEENNGTYTWYMYADEDPYDNPDTEIYDEPNEYTRYEGISDNQYTDNPSYNYEDYIWSEYVYTPQNYTHIKYADHIPTANSDMYDTPKSTTSYKGTIELASSEAPNNYHIYNWEPFTPNEYHKYSDVLPTSNYDMYSYPTNTTRYEGIAYTESSVAPEDYTEYNWVLYDVENGDDNIESSDDEPTNPNTGGHTIYTHIRYADNNPRLNPLTPIYEYPTSTTQYKGLAKTTSNIAPTDYRAYTWTRYIPGEQSYYTHKKYADVLPSSNNDMYDEPKSTTQYEGVVVNTSSIAPTNYKAYTWKVYTSGSSGTDVNPIITVEEHTINEQDIIFTNISGELSEINANNVQNNFVSTYVFFNSYLTDKTGIPNIGFKVDYEWNDTINGNYYKADYRYVVYKSLYDSYRFISKDINYTSINKTADYYTKSENYITRLYDSKNNYINWQSSYNNVLWIPNCVHIVNSSSPQPTIKLTAYNLNNLNLDNENNARGLYIGEYTLSERIFKDAMQNITSSYLYAILGESDKVEIVSGINGTGLYQDNIYSNKLIKELRDYRLAIDGPVYFKPDLTYITTQQTENEYLLHHETKGHILNSILDYKSTFIDYYMFANFAEYNEKTGDCNTLTLGCIWLYDPYKILWIYDDKEILISLNIYAENEEIAIEDKLFKFKIEHTSNSVSYMYPDWYDINTNNYLIHCEQKDIKRITFNYAIDYDYYVANKRIEELDDVPLAPEGKVLYVEVPKEETSDDNINIDDITPGPDPDPDPGNELKIPSKCAEMWIVEDYVEKTTSSDNHVFLHDMAIGIRFKETDWGTGLIDGIQRNLKLGGNNGNIYLLYFKMKYNGSTFYDKNGKSILAFTYRNNYSSNGCVLKLCVNETIMVNKYDMDKWTAETNASIPSSRNEDLLDFDLGGKSIESYFKDSNFKFDLYGIGIVRSSTDISRSVISVSEGTYGINVYYDKSKGDPFTDKKSSNINMTERVTVWTAFKYWQRFNELPPLNHFSNNWPPGGINNKPIESTSPGETVTLSGMYDVEEGNIVYIPEKDGGNKHVSESNRLHKAGLNISNHSTLCEEDPNGGDNGGNTQTSDDDTSIEIDGVIYVIASKFDFSLHDGDDDWEIKEIIQNGITYYAWVKKQSADEKINNSLSDIKDVLESIVDALNNISTQNWGCNCNGSGGNGNNGGNSGNDDTPSTPTISGTTPFTDSTSVTINSTSGSTIYYTFNGDDPTNTSPYNGTSPVTFTLSKEEHFGTATSIIIKAIAYKNGYSSGIESKEFTLNDNGGETIILKAPKINSIQGSYDNDPVIKMYLDESISIQITSESEGTIRYISSNSPIIDTINTSSGTEYTEILTEVSINMSDKFIKAFVVNGDNISEVTYVKFIYNTYRGITSGAGDNQDKLDDITVKVGGTTINSSQYETDENTVNNITLEGDGVIFYSTNEYDPNPSINMSDQELFNEGVEEYSSSITIDKLDESSKTLKAYSWVGGVISQLKEVTFNYNNNITVSDPLFINNDTGNSIVESNFPFTNTLSISLYESNGADVYYREDNTDPTTSDTKYTTSIEISSDKTISAKAFKGSKSSSTVTKTFTKNIFAPKFTFGNETYGGNSQAGSENEYITNTNIDLRLECDTNNVIIKYCMDTSTTDTLPTVTNPSSTVGTEFVNNSSNKLDIIFLAGEPTEWNSIKSYLIKAVAYDQTDNTKISGITTLAIRYNNDQLEEPTIAGGITEFEGSSYTVEILCTNADNIYYTMNESNDIEPNDPTTESNLYISTNKPTITNTTIIKARGYKNGVPGKVATKKITKITSTEETIYNFGAYKYGTTPNTSSLVYGTNNGSNDQIIMELNNTLGSVATLKNEGAAASLYVNSPNDRIYFYYESDKISLSNLHSENGGLFITVETLNGYFNTLIEKRFYDLNDHEISSSSNYTTFTETESDGKKIAQGYIKLSLRNDATVETGHQVSEYIYGSSNLIYIYPYGHDSNDDHKLKIFFAGT